VLADNFIKDLSGARMAVINTGRRAVWRAFKQLHAYRTQGIAYTACGLPDIADVLELCARHKVFAVVLGAASDNILPTLSSVAVITPAVSRETSYLQHLLQHPLLTNFAALAFQTYLTPAPVLEELNDRYFETLRLGAFRNNPADAEPVLRDAEYVWFDLSAVRASDAPATLRPGPNGLYSEEACQLGYYVGSSGRTKALFLFGYKPYIWTSSRTAQLVGQLLWHVAEAAAGRIYENIESGIAGRPEFKEIIVDMGKQGQNLHFANSLTTRRWWMKVPVTKDIAQWIACLPTDYDTACRGEIPLRWLWYYQKLNY
jgi:hypothetical protein